MKENKILIVGMSSGFCLETSYANAAVQLNLQVIRFNPANKILKYIKLGKIGRALHDFITIEIWAKKMNRDLVIMVKEENPTVILLVGGSRIHYGTITTIKAISPTSKIVWVWPDTPLNLNTNNLSYGAILDMSATYSKTTLDSFHSLGFKNPYWLPLAGDVHMHWCQIPTEDDFYCDISFVGMWRPERERIMKVIKENFGHLKIEIYGAYWKRDCKDEDLRKKWKGEGLYAKDLASYFNKSRINVNIIDDTNYPAANMRFFEIPTAGGLQLCSKCPEFENEFIDGEDIVFYKDEEDVIKQINSILDDAQLAMKIRQSAQLKIKDKHNYKIRLQEILYFINAR
jgi:hypothetical protein